MRKIAVIASLICCLVLSDMAFAMPIASAIWSQKPPTHKSCPHVADVAPADIAGHMAAAGRTAGKTPQTGIHRQQPMDSGSDLPALVRGLTLTVEAGAARPNRRTAHRS